MVHHQRRHGVLLFVVLVSVVWLMFWNLARSRHEIQVKGRTVMRVSRNDSNLTLHRQIYEAKHADSQNGIIVIADSGTHEMQTLVVSPKPGLLIALGTTEYHECPLPNYIKEDFRLLSMNTNQTFDAVHFNFNPRATLGPLISVTFRVPRVLWQNLILDGGGKLKLLNLNSSTLQEMQVLVDPALSARIPKRFLSATTTIRKSYRFYQGGALSDNSTKPSAWNDDEIVRRLNVWLEHYRSIGIQHFYIIDNEHDLVKPNLPLSNGSDVTYIRSPHSDYDFWNCEQQDYTVTGQGILENSIIHMAHTDWLLVLDIDEFIMLNSRYNNSLLKLVDYFQHIHCSDEGGVFFNLTCHPLHTTDTYEQIYAIMFISIFMNNIIQNQTWDECGFRMKGLLRTSLVEMLAVHYPQSVEKSRYADTRVPPRQAWMAHFNDYISHRNTTYSEWKEIISGLSLLTPLMRSK